MRSLRGTNAEAVITRLTPIVRGWAAYYRSAVSTEAFAAIDHYLWQRLYRWAISAHPNKSRHWVATRYFDAFNPSRNDRWVYGDRTSGRYLRRFSWTKIVRHTLVMGTASPDDPALEQYWAQRRRKSYTWLSGVTASLMFRQQGLCPACGTLLLDANHGPNTPQQWEQWARTITKAHHKRALVLDAQNDGDQTAHLLIHTHCRSSRGSALGPANNIQENARGTCLSQMR